MKLTEELILNCGFTKKFGWGSEYYQYGYTDLMLFKKHTVNGRYMCLLPETVEEFIKILIKFVKETSIEEGKYSAQQNIKLALGISLEDA